MRQNDDLAELADPQYRVDVWIDRYRGEINRANHLFVVYAENGGLHWWGEVREHVSTPEELFDKIAERYGLRKTLGPLKAGGVMDQNAINFTIVHVPLTEIRAYIVRAFGFRQDPYLKLYRYENAHVLLHSEDSGWGTVGEILEQHGCAIR